MGSYIDNKLYPNTYTKLGSAIDLDSEVNGVLTVVNGGTGSPTASAARVNLGVGTIGTLNTVVPVASGGTGSPTASAARVNLGVNIGTDVQKYDQSLDVVGQLYSTGHLSGGIISLNVDNTKFDVSAGSGYVVDNYTDPYHPTVTRVSWNNYTGVTDLRLSNSFATQILIDNTGSIVQLSAIPTSTELRDYIYLGKTVHNNLSSINAVVSAPKVEYNVPLLLFDYIDAVGPVNVYGNVISNNGATLSIKKSEGSIFRLGSNYNNSHKSPNVISLSAVNPLGFVYGYRNGSGRFVTTASTTAVDPTKYDDGTGTLATVGTAQWSIQRVYVYISGLVYITYGQAVYSSLANAVDSVTVEEPVIDQELRDACLRAYLILKGNTTDLSDTTNNKISKVGKISPPL